MICHNIQYVVIQKNQDPPLLSNIAIHKYLQLWFVFNLDIQTLVNAENVAAYVLYTLLSSSAVKIILLIKILFHRFLHNLFHLQKCSPRRSSRREEWGKFIFLFVCLKSWHQNKLCCLAPFDHIDSSVPYIFFDWQSGQSDLQISAQLFRFKCTSCFKVSLLSSLTSKYWAFLR